MPAPLDVEGTLVLEREGVEALRLDADGALVRARFERLSDAWSLARSLRASLPAGRALAAFVTSCFDRADVVVEIRIGPHLVARAGAGVRAGFVARFLRVGPVDVEVFGLMRAVLGG